MRPRYRARRLRRSLIVLGVLLMLGHVCELPVETPSIIGHAEAEESDGHGDSIHAASCEAAAAGPVAPVVVEAVAVAVLDPAPPAVDAVRAVPLRTATASPPLFLLHASFLI